ncbi:MAG: FKBP-type peptidyl-prolyl cis-trans isomerase [Bacteroidia bacterium]|nr:FKBP-type peptidyl-prolyl cis-trans isomerase [Bacteroidia bacterium]
MKRISPVLSFLLLLGFSSCFRDSDFEGYTKTDTGLHYKLLMIGEGKRKPTFGELLQLNITYKTMADSIFLDSYSINETGMVILPFNHSSFKGSFEEGLLNMCEGDSVSFIVEAKPLFKEFFKAELPYFLKEGDKVKMEVKLNRILDQKQYEQEIVRYKELLEDRDIEEQRILQVYLDTIPGTFTPLENGMYFQPVQQGVGDLIERGDGVRVHFKGSFLNGRTFESTYERNQPMEFTFGEQGQVIKGLEAAISLLNEGAQAKFIIPSHLAYGENGSSTGVIPPYTTLVYEIELLKLTKHNN